MRPIHLIALTAAGLVLACEDHASPRITEINQLLDSTSVATLTVTVLGLTRDSSFKPVANASVRFVRVGDVPPDSIPDSLPPPPPPPDSTPPTDSLTAWGGPTYQLADSIPGDTTPPPPPPPPPTCGRTGPVLFRGRTNREGVVTANGLRSGEYDVVVKAPAGSRLGDGVICGVHVLPGQANQVQLVLVPAAR